MIRKFLVYLTIAAFAVTTIGGCATTYGGRGYRYYHVRSRNGKIKIHEKRETEIGKNLASVQKLAIYTGGALAAVGIIYLLTRNHKAKAKAEPKPEPKPEEKRIMVCQGRKFLLKEGKAYEIRNGRISGEGKGYEIVDRYLILDGKTAIDCDCN